MNGRISAKVSSLLPGGRRQHLVGREFAVVVDVLLELLARHHDARLAGRVPHFQGAVLPADGFGLVLGLLRE